MKDTVSVVAPPQTGLRPLYFYFVVLIVFICDQVSKAMIQRSLAFGEYRKIFGTSFMLTLTQNPGGAWGLLPTGNHVFVVFAAIAIVALLFAYHRVARGDLLVASAFALALGGAVGNLLDRLRYGYVVDFFDVRIIRWPIFNVADSAISLGIVLLLLHYVLTIRSEASARTSTSLSTVTSPPLVTEDIANNVRE